MTRYDWVAGEGKCPALGTEHVLAEGLGQQTGRKRLKPASLNHAESALERAQTLKMPAIKWDDLAALEFALPPDRLLERYAALGGVLLSISPVTEGRLVSRPSCSGATC